MKLKYKFLLSVFLLMALVVIGSGVMMVLSEPSLHSMRATMVGVGLVSLLALMIGIFGLISLSRTMRNPIQADFTNSVTHELRSPLTAIERLIQLSIEGEFGPLTSDLKETLIMVRNYSTQLRGFVDNLLIQAKLESKHVDLYQEIFDLRQAIEESHRFYLALAEEKKLAFHVHLPENPLWVWADRLKVSQILSNLISNAFKFTQQGSVTIGATQGVQGANVSVVDTGMGVPKKDRTKIFEKFYQSPGIARRSKGTGLGLSIVKDLVEIQGGHIHVETNGPGGSCFIFSLPTKPIKEPARLELR